MKSSKISFVSDGYKLAGHLFIPDGKPKKLAFLFIQGWQGHQNLPAAQTLANLDYTTMTYDMRGNEESEGNIADFSREDFIKDAGVAYDYLKQQVGEDVAIGAIGSSFGSYTAVLLTEQRDAYCLSLRVPATYPDEGYTDPQLAQFDSKEQEEWRKKEVSYTENHGFKLLHDFKGKVLIIEAGADEIVNAQAPKNYANAVADKTKLTYKVMLGAPHRLENERLQTEYEKLLTAWVETL